MGVTALIVGGLGAAGAIGSSAISANAAGNASSQQVAAQRAALQQQQSLFNQGLGVQSGYFDKASTAFDTARNALSLYATAGESVLPTLSGLLTPGPNQNALLSQTPGFQFTNQYGQMAATNALASRGLGASAGPVATAAAEYSSGLASNTWQNVVNALQGYAGLGANAAGGIASSANNFAGIAGNAGNAALGASTNQAQLQGNTIGNIGNAQAAGTLGSANAIASGVSGTANSLGSAALLSGLQGGGGIYGKLSGPAYGGGNVLTDAYGGNPNNPLPGLTSADYAAKGGHTSAKSKRPIVVGENGPELFVPDEAGTIVPYARVKKAMKEKNCLTTRGLTRELGRAA